MSIITCMVQKLCHGSSDETGGFKWKQGGAWDVLLCGCRLKQLPPVLLALMNEQILTKLCMHVAVAPVSYSHQLQTHCHTVLQAQNQRTQHSWQHA